MVNKPITEVMEGGAKLAKALNDAGIPVTFGKRSEGNTDLSGVIDLASNNIGTGSIPLLEDIESRIHEELGIPFLTTNETGTNSLIWDIIEYDYGDDVVKYKDSELVNNDVLTSALNNKQNTLVSGTNIKTINGESLLGNTDITITGIDVGTFTDLQTLITNVSSGGTIVLDKDYKYDSSTDSSLTNGINIDKTITILGNGHIIDGNNNSRAFWVTGQNTVATILDIRIQNCKSTGSGGAIQAIQTATVNINNTQFTNNTSPNDGGTIYAYSATVNINNTQFTNNTANIDGGAIYAVSSATVNINNTQFTNNTATDEGGAIHATQSATVNITNTTFNQNTATGTYSNGGAIYASNGVLSLYSCSFNDNTASNRNDIYSSNEIIVYDCIIPDISTSCYHVTNITTESLNNSKQPLLESGTNIKTINNESLLGSGNITVSGGASTGTFTDLQTLITNASSGDVITLDKDYKYDSTIDSNLTNGIVINKTITINGNGHIIDGNNTQRAFYMNNQSGKTLTLEDLRIQNCKSTIGGVIYLNNHADANINNCKFKNNSTSSYDAGVFYIIDNCKVNITNSEFINNTTTRNGGVFYLYSNVYLTIDDSRFIGNKGKIGGVFYAWSNSYVTINESIFSLNSSTQYEGGVLYTSEAKNILITDCVFTNNSSNKYGGVIYANGGYITIKRCQLTDNSATQRGGALDINNINSSYPLQIIDSVIHSNTCNSYANAYVSSVTTVYNCILSDNASTYYNLTNKPYLTDHQSITGKQDTLVSGTNIKTINNESLLGSGNITIQGGGSEIGTFSDLVDLIDNAYNGDTIILDRDYKYDPSTDGGRENGTYIDKDITIIGNGHIIDGNNNSRAFYIEDYIVNLYDLRIQNCNSNGDAGAIFIYSGATVYISKVQFINNNATNYGNGGAIYVDNATVNINNTTFTQNTADHYGGAICTNYATVTMINSSFRDNTATNFFDSIYSSNAITVYDCIIPNIATTCYRVTNITTESLYDAIEGLEEDMLL